MSAYKLLGALSALGLGIVAAGAHADTIADWTFDSTAPATAGPFSPEVGAGAASGFHASTTTYSAPVGNGSAHSFSSNGWSVGDYYQFRVSTTNLQNVQLSWDQTGSTTGPKDFELQYSVNGTSFSDLLSYSILANSDPNAWSSTGAPKAMFTFTQDLSSLSILDNQSNVYFRLVDRDTTALRGDTVASGGTDRVDNVIITASPVPVPAAIWLLGSGLFGLAGLRRRR